ncbi:MAG: hypothetical protein HOV77_31895 [Hamadaea sp.]|uniref:hypothetical protein n=1 Tax=Hamadaea sp. TaxID=2024425 RepID=UPI0018281D3B|nr:hypothetical protein [Hamadaea sp.]NUT23790.1 hypothetical protein [Hamadaea sp.]
MTQSIPTLTGQDIAEAQGALRALLDTMLAGTDATANEFITLRVLAVRGPYEDPGVLHDFLVSQRQLDLTPLGAADLLAGLEEAGLAEGTARAAGPARITDAGKRVLTRLTELTSPATRQVFGDLDPAELATARRVLAEVTQRADQLRAAI